MWSCQWSIHMFNVGIIPGSPELKKRWKSPKKKELVDFHQNPNFPLRYFISFYIILFDCLCFCISCIALKIFFLQTCLNNIIFHEWLYRCLVRSDNTWYVDITQWNAVIIIMREKKRQPFCSFREGGGVCSLSNFVIRYLQKTYNFLKHCVESRPDDYSMPQDWMDNILARVPAELTETPKQKEHREELCNLVRDDFKKVLVQFTGNVSYLLCVNAGRYKFVLEKKIITAF